MTKQIQRRIRYNWISHTTVSCIRNHECMSLIHAIYRSLSFKNRTSIDCNVSLINNIFKHMNTLFFLIFIINFIRRQRYLIYVYDEYIYPPMVVHCFFFFSFLKMMCKQTIDGHMVYPSSLTYKETVRSISIVFWLS